MSRMLINSYADGDPTCDDDVDQLLMNYLM